MLTSNIKILISGHDLKFLTPLIQRLEATSSYSVRILLHKGHHIDNPEAAQEALDWADVIFCEWALGNAVWFSERKRTNQVLIVRLHLQEVQARDRIDFIWRINWEKVDRLVLITQHVYDWMLYEFPLLAGRAALVYNPIPARTALDLPKSIDSRFTLGLVGVVPARKRLDLAVALLRRLRTIDERYILRVKGALPSDYPWMANRTEEMAWYNNLFENLGDLSAQGAVIFEPHGPDMATWYQGIGHILSVSDFEGSHQAVAEGMASGCIPSIRDWVGADRIYPPKYIAGRIEELAQLIHRNTEIDSFLANSEYSRQFAQEQFDNEPNCSTLEAIIAQELRRVRGSAINSLLVNVAQHRPNFLIVAYIPVGSRSGYRIRVEQEIQALTQLGCKVHLACLIPQHKSINITDDLQSQRASHVAEFASMGCTMHLIEIDDFFRINVTTESFADVSAELIGIVERHDIDVIHAEALYCARVAASVKMEQSTVLFSIDWHGIIPEESRMGGAHKIRVDALEEAESKLLKDADLNIFVSKSMHSHYVRKYGQIKNNYAIVPCCVGDGRFIDPSQNFNSALFPSDSIIFGYAGTMADWQCGLEMITLFSSLYKANKKCRFLLLIPSSDQACAKNYCTQAGLPTEALLMTEVSHDEVPKWIGVCHVGVMIRRTDSVNFVSSPTKFAEYLAAGLPILMTDAIGDYRDLLNATDIGFIVKSEYFFNEGNAPFSNALLHDIISFAQHSALYRLSIAKKCQTIAREALHWENSAKKWINSYNLTPPAPI